MQQKLKSLLANDTLFMTLLVVLVGVSSFGLGRVSVVEKDTAAAVQLAQVAGAERGEAPQETFTEAISEGVSLSQPLEATAEAETAQVTASLRVVGSRSGAKYHLPSCPGAKQIKEENKVFFESVEQARAAGYTPAANCPGLQ